MDGKERERERGQTSLRCDALSFSEVKEITATEIIIDTADGEVSIKNDFVLALTGYMPNFEFLEKLGIDLSEDEKRLPSYDPETMETNVPDLFLAGVICGGMETHKWFIENSRIHAPIIMDAILQRRSQRQDR